MNNLKYFLNIRQYNLWIYCVNALVISELLIWIFTSKWSVRRKDRKDRGTLWIIIIGWLMSFMAGSFFRSSNVPEFMRNILIPEIFYYIGIGCIFLGIIIRITAVITLKKSFTLSVQVTKEQKLITKGIYSIVRNPAYTGSIISLFGVSLIYRNIFGIISVIIICFSCYSIRINTEEKILEIQFESEFTNYCKKTKYKLIPFIY